MLPSLIPVGSTLTFTVGVETTILNSVLDIETGLTSGLANQGLSVRAWSSSGSLAQLGIPYTSVVLTGTIFTTGVFSDLATIESIIDGAAMDFLGSPPVSATSITSATLPVNATAGSGGVPNALGGVVQSGQPAASAPQTPGFITGIEDFFSGLQADAITTLVIIGAIILVILLVVGFSPNVGRIASAAI